MIEDPVLDTCDSYEEAQELIDQTNKVLKRMKLDDVRRVYWLPMEIGKPFPAYRVFLGYK